MCFIIFSYNNYLSKFPNRVIAGFVKNTNGPCKGKVEAKHDFGLECGVKSSYVVTPSSQVYPSNLELSTGW